MKVKPRDHDITDRVGGVRVGRLFSNLVSPPVMFALLALALAWAELPFWTGLAWAAVFGFFISLLPILFIAYLLHTGRVGELHMSNTQERRLPYLVTMCGSFLVLGLLVIFDGPPLLRCLALLNIFTLVSLMLVNSHWLISFHATGAASSVMVIGLVFGIVTALYFLPLLFLVILVRLYLRRHTVAQVVGGTLLGVLSVSVLSFLGCFIA
ncbi:MAG: hypothetical protein R3272_14380 [Candidatus Promineifilaceae bacterium]|nr:hypothetical protein [Candidatus Promineifilaceae bacterium]